MFIGEGSTFFLFLYLKYKNKSLYYAELQDAEAKGLRTDNWKYLYLLIPACSDFFTSTLQYISLNYIQPSVY